MKGGMVDAQKSASWWMTVSGPDQRIEGRKKGKITSGESEMKRTRINGAKKEDVHKESRAKERLESATTL
jgi:hypothetical protein